MVAVANKLTENKSNIANQMHSCKCGIKVNIAIKDYMEKSMWIMSGRSAGCQRSGLGLINYRAQRQPLYASRWCG